MGRPGLANHPKFRLLMRLLGEPYPHVRGYLETLWEVAYECGNPVIGDPEGIEASAQYPGEPGKLFAALLRCGGPGRAGFIEECPGQAGLYQIHDLNHHAPDYVRKRKQRELGRCETADNGGQRQTMADNGAERRRTAPNGAERRTTADNGAERRTTADNGGQRQTMADNGAERLHSQHPAPAPSTRTQHPHPAPKKKEEAPAKPACPPELKAWLDWWNGLRAENAVSCGADSASPSNAVQKAWKRTVKSHELMDLLSDRDRLASEIRCSAFCREAWFTLPVLLGGVNRNGEYIVQKLLAGAYRGERKSNARPEPGRGQRYTEGSSLGPV